MRINIFGVRISFSFLFLLLVSFGIVTSVQGQRVIMFALFSAVIHEIGHIVFITFLKEKPCSIDIGLYEVKINSNIDSCSFKEDLLITLAGVFFNFTLALILWITSLSFDSLWIIELCLCSLCVGLINLVPIESFDGGQLVYIIISRLLSVKAANAIMTVTTIIFVFPFTILGIYLLFSSQYNFSLLFIAIYLLIFIFKKYLS